MSVPVRLVVGLVSAGVRWQLRTLPAAVGYRLRPFCWRLDERHWCWRHRRCMRTPCLIDLRDQPADLELALQRLVERPPQNSTKEWR